MLVYVLCNIEEIDLFQLRYHSWRRIVALTLYVHAYGIDFPEDLLEAILIVAIARKKKSCEDSSTTFFFNMHAYKTIDFFR